ncbi:MAG: peptidoglycan-binding protein [Ktedonobacteraceae bacterium]|nr:peptidoglycan-binding protein [Ktedonobacteraceae bacterium]
MRTKLALVILLIALFVGASLSYSGTAHASAATPATNTHTSVALLTCPPTISYGTSQYNLVIVLQDNLDRYYGYHLDIDGHFGSLTRAAVKDFQAHYAPPSDGVVGPITWNALQECY